MRKQTCCASLTSVKQQMKRFDAPSHAAPASSSAPPPLPGAAEGYLLPDCGGGGGAFRMKCIRFNFCPTKSAAE